MNAASGVDSPQPSSATCRHPRPARRRSDRTRLGAHPRPSPATSPSPGRPARAPRSAARGPRRQADQEKSNGTVSNTATPGEQQAASGRATGLRPPTPSASRAASTSSRSCGSDPPAPSRAPSRSPLERQPAPRAPPPGGRTGPRRRGARKRRLARQALTQQATKRIHVRAAVHLHRRGSAPEQHSRSSRASPARPSAVRQPRRQPEIRQIHVVARVEQDIRGLDVAMHQPAFVREVERVSDLRAHRDGPLRAQRPLAQQLLQIAPST